MKLLLPSAFTGLLCLTGISKRHRTNRKGLSRPARCQYCTAGPDGAQARKKSKARNPGPKPYKEVITSKAISKPGLFTVHHVEDKWYFEIPDSLMGREFMAITRLCPQTPGRQRQSMEARRWPMKQTMRWEKGPDNKLFLRSASPPDPQRSQGQHPAHLFDRAVLNSYLDPIAAAFDIKAFGPDSSSTVIDVTDFFKGDNQVVSIDPNIKRRFKLSAV